MSSTPNASDTPSRAFWTPEELEQMVQWLEDPSNQSRFKKGSGLTKEAALTPLASQLSSGTAKQIFDKYCNIKLALEAEILRYKVLLAQAHGGGGPSTGRGEDF
jgi:hypothetical protein